jgi:hypothetical protein
MLPMCCFVPFALCHFYLLIHASFLQFMRRGIYRNSVQYNVQKTRQTVYQQEMMIGLHHPYDAMQNHEKIPGKLQSEIMCK